MTSVCAGSLILSAAGLLIVRRATSHWAWRNLLPIFGAIADDERVVRDGNVITGGGVTGGVDLALTVLAELAGNKLAEITQLGLGYSPQPPFNAGRPDTAPPHVLAAYLQQIAREVARREDKVRQAAHRLASFEAGSGSSNESADDRSQIQKAGPDAQIKQVLQRQTLSTKQPLRLS